MRALEHSTSKPGYQGAARTGYQGISQCTSKGTPCNAHWTQHRSAHQARSPAIAQALAVLRMALLSHLLVRGISDERQTRGVATKARALRAQPAVSTLLCRNSTKLPCSLRTCKGEPSSRLLQQTKRMPSAARHMEEAHHCVCDAHKYKQPDGVVGVDVELQARAAHRRAE